MTTTSSHVAHSLNPSLEIEPYLQDTLNLALVQQLADWACDETLTHEALESEQQLQAALADESLYMSEAAKSKLLQKMMQYP